MKIWTDKNGKELNFKEFIDRFKEGVNGITPKQKIISQIWGTRINLLGIVLGIIASIIAFKNLWWVMIILIGALIVTGTQYLGLVQQRKLFDDIEKQINEVVLNDGKEKVGMSDLSMDTKEIFDKSLKGGENE